MRQLTSPITVPMKLLITITSAQSLLNDTKNLLIDYSVRVKSGRKILGVTVSNSSDLSAETVSSGWIDPVFSL